jgi:hypothetical protein
MNKEILASLEKLIPQLEAIGDAVSVLQSEIDLPDFNELQRNDETAKLGYAIEDFEIAASNIDQEVSDAWTAIEKIKRLLGEKS